VTLQRFPRTRVLRFEFALFSCLTFQKSAP
jgi:hypothetical protein